MIPTAAVQALAVMDRWAIPLQEELVLEIQRMTEANPLDPEIAEAQRHVGAVFIGADKDRSGRVRILTDSAWNIALTSFARGIGLNWVLSTHQFRRKFANYAARSRFGDLRYLREHFKHWSQDMTNDAYALNESQEIELYGEILEELAAIKQGVADQWLSPAEPLAGGYGGDSPSGGARTRTSFFSRIGQQWFGQWRRAMQSVATGTHGVLQTTIGVLETLSRRRAAVVATMRSLVAFMLISTSVSIAISRMSPSAKTLDKVGDCVYFATLSAVATYCFPWDTIRMLTPNDYETKARRCQAQGT